MNSSKQESFLLCEMLRQKGGEGGEGSGQGTCRTYTPVGHITPSIFSSHFKGSRTQGIATSLSAPNILSSSEFSLQSHLQFSSPAPMTASALKSKLSSLLQSKHYRWNKAVVSFLSFITNILNTFWLNASQNARLWVYVDEQHNLSESKYSNISCL